MTRSSGDVILMPRRHQTSQISGTISTKTIYFKGHKVLPSSCLLVTSCGCTRRRFTRTTDKKNISTKFQL